VFWLAAAFLGIVIPMACTNTGSYFNPTSPSTPVVVSATATNAFGFTSTPTFTIQPTSTITNTPVVTPMTGASLLCSPNAPNGLAVAGGDIYVAGGDGTLSVYTTSGAAVTHFNNYGVTLFSSLSGVALDSTGKLYVLDSGGSDTSTGTVYEFDSTTSPFTAVTAWNNYNSAPFISPQGIAVDSNKNVYVADTGHNVVDEFAPGGAATALIGYSGGGGNGHFDNPTGIATNGSGSSVTVFVADMDDELIQEFVSGSFVGQFSTQQESLDPGVLGIAADSGGDLFAADYDNGFVDDYNSTSSPVTLKARWAPASNPFGPTGVAYNGTKLYVADYDNKAVYSVNP